MVYGNGQRWRHNGRRLADGQRRRSPADHAAVKACYAILQAKHHLILVNRALADDHKMFKSKVSELDKFFKTAGDKNDPQYLQKKHQINVDWRSAHLQNHKEHFERMISKNADLLKNQKLTKNKILEFLNQGADWARKSFGKKFTKKDFDEGREIVLRQITEHVNSGNKTAAPASSNAPPRAQQTVPTRDDRAEPENDNSGQTTANASQHAQTRPPVPPPRQARPVPSPRQTRSGQNTPAGTQSKKRVASPRVSPSSEERPNPGKKPNFDDKSPPRAPNFDKSPAAAPSKTPVLNPASKSPRSQELPPAQQGASTSKTPCDNGSRFRVLDEQQVDNIEFATPEVPEKTTRNQTPKATPSKRKRGGSRKNSPSTPPEETGETTPKRKAQTNGVTGGSPVLRTESGSPNGDSQSDFVENSQKPIFKTSEKIIKYPNLDGAKGKAVKQKWQLPTLTTNTLVIGDENFERVENIEHDPHEALVLSFPDLKLNNLKLVLEDRRDRVTEYVKNPRENPSPGYMPKQVIFSIGAHDQGMQTSSIHSQLGAIKPLILNQFSSSKIYFSPVNPVDSNAKAFNKTVADFCEKQKNWVFLDRFDLGIQFETDPADPTHWSHDCAQSIAYSLLTLDDRDYFD